MNAGPATDRVEPLPRAVILLAFALLAARLLLAANIELAFDEAYYWTWAQNPALSYFDHPPMVAWFVAAGTAIAGDTELGVRLLGPLAVFASTLLMMATVRDLGGCRIGMIFAGLFSELTVAGQAVAIIMTPDTPLLFFVALTLRLLAAIIAGGPNAIWLAVGVAAGGALLSKYTAVFVGIGIALWLVLVPARRRLLATVWPWVGGLVALVVFSPVLIWNVQNDWLSFFKQGGRVAVPFNPSFATFGDFVGAQLGLATPLIGVALGIGLYHMVREGMRSRTDRGVLLPALSLPLLFYLAWLSIGSHVEGNWTLASVPPAIAAAAVVLAATWQRLTVRKFAAAAAGLGAVMSAGLLAYVAIPFDHDFGRRDPTHQLSGHRDVAAEVGKVADREGISTIATTDYQTFGLMSFYLPRSLDVVQADERERYRAWVVPAKAAADFAAGTVLIVVPTRDVKTGERLFAETEEVGRVRRLHRGFVVDEVVLLRAVGFRSEL